MKQILKPAGILFLITALTAAALSGVNMLTESRIGAARELKSEQAIQQVLPNAENLKSIPFSDDTGLVQSVFSPDGDPASGIYAVKVTPSGFGGVITMMVGVQDGSISGISIISHSETPSLGAVAASAGSRGTAFRDQFTGLTSPLAVAKDGGQIDAVTSATITSRAVAQGADAALRCAISLG